MLQANVKKSNINYFVDLKLTGIRVEEFMFSLLFGFDKQMEVTTHWELVDMITDNHLDRGMALKISEQLLLFKLIGNKMVKLL